MQAMPDAACETKLENDRELLDPETESHRRIRLPLDNRRPHKWLGGACHPILFGESIHTMLSKSITYRDIWMLKRLRFLNHT